MFGCYGSAFVPQYAYLLAPTTPSKSLINYIESLLGSGFKASYGCRMTLWARQPKHELLYSQGVIQGYIGT